ncbi:hypothetical protein Tco_0300424 [Tanacetum coccineum]
MAYLPFITNTTYYVQQINTAYSVNCIRRIDHLILQQIECITRSSTKKLLKPFKELERVFHSTRRLFKTSSLDYSSSLEFDLFSDLENQSEKEVTEAMAEPNMEEYMMKTREDYGSSIDRPKILEKDHFKLKGQFLMKLRDNTFSGSDNNDVNEHIEKALMSTKS